MENLGINKDRPFTGGQRSGRLFFEDNSDRDQSDVAVKQSSDSHDL